MSGGSFGYLYSKETLLGRSETVFAMAHDVREHAQDKTRTKHDGESWVPLTMQDKQELLEAAGELEKLANWLQHVEQRCDSKQEFYADLLKSVEWTASGDTGIEDILETYQLMTEKR